VERAPRRRSAHLGSCTAPPNSTPTLRLRMERSGTDGRCEHEERTPSREILETPPFSFALLIRAWWFESSRLSQLQVIHRQLRCAFALDVSFGSKTATWTTQRRVWRPTHRDRSSSPVNVGRDPGLIASRPGSWPRGVEVASGDLPPGRQAPIFQDPTARSRRPPLNVFPRHKLDVAA
jgi:hypothetical protein